MKMKLKSENMSPRFIRDPRERERLIFMKQLKFD